MPDIHRLGLKARQILDASPNAVVAVDQTGQIVYANDMVERTFGWRPGELLGRPVEDLIPASLAERHREHRATFAANPKARPMGIGLDLMARRRDGSEFPAEISLVPFDSATGLTVVATIVDISARRALETELFEARKLESIGRLSGAIAHDFNNVLTAIIGFADIALAKAPGEDTGPELDTVRRAAQRAAGLTQQLLAFGRRQVLHPEIVDPNEAISGVEPILRRLIDEKIELVVSLTPGVGTIKVDPTQLSQVILNLALNARDAMPDGGRLVIATERAHVDQTDLSRHFEVGPGDYAAISVIDTGIGMSEETRRHLFEPFFTTKEVGKGTGLGLATTHGIVRQSGGYIWVYSEPGHGSTFRIYFPIEPGEPAAAPETEPSAASSRTSRRVLLVEDEPLLRDLARRVLEAAGFEVLQAASPAQAIDVFEAEGSPIDLLVSDVVMPGASGSTLARELRLRAPELRVLLMSGYSDEIVQARESDREAFISKPFTPAELVAAADRALSGAGQGSTSGDGQRDPRSAQNRRSRRQKAFTRGPGS